MIINSMEDILIEIYKIKNIEKIKILNLSLKNNTNIDIIPSLIITYDNGKSLVLNERDKYFKTFVKKVTEVYNDEKDKIISNNIDPFKLNNQIDISEHDRKILENGVLTSINKEYEFYKDKKSYLESMFFKNDEIKAVFDILKYHIEDLFNENNIDISEKINGYQDRYITECKIDNIYKKINLNYNKITDNNFYFEISHLFNDLSTLKLNIIFKNNMILIKTNIELNDTNIYGEYNYSLEENGLKYIKNISKNNICLFYEDKYLEQTDNENKIDFDLKYSDNVKWYKLPWNAFFGYEINNNNISDNEKIIERHYIYNIKKDNYFLSKEKYTKIYQQINKYNEIVLDHMDKNILGLLVDKDYYITETSFLDCNFKNGFYDERLNGYYFYNLVKNNKFIKEFKDISDKSELLNKQLVLKGVK